MTKERMEEIYKEGFTRPCNCGAKAGCHLGIVEENFWWMFNELKALQRYISPTKTCERAEGNDYCIIHHGWCL